MNIENPKFNKNWQLIHFELIAIWIKKELEKYSANGIIFSYNKNYNFSYSYSKLWFILFEGYRYINGNKKKITLLFEYYYPYDQKSYCIIEASGVFPNIYYNNQIYENYGREYILNYKYFIEKFMNAIFTNKNE